MTLISRVLTVSAIVTGLRRGNCPHQLGLQPAPCLQRQNRKAATGSNASGWLYAGRPFRQRKHLLRNLSDRWATERKAPC